MRKNLKVLAYSFMRLAELMNFKEFQMLIIFAENAIAARSMK